MKTSLALILALTLAAPLEAQVTLRVNLPGSTIDLSAPAVPREASAHALANKLPWENLRPGLEMTTLTADAGRLGLNVRIIVARIDPALFTFKLQHATKANRMSGAWTVDVAPDDAVLALNAGQFKETGPWGWLVLDGVERRDPGFGPLSAGIAFDSVGGVHWLPFAQLSAGKTSAGIRDAFQSYPVLLFDGRVPALATGDELDQTHRDARLVLAQDTAGRLMIVLTRFDGLRGAAARVPIGLTVPESIVLLQALGARHAVMLDGGISAQLLLRDRNGSVRTWKGLRAVPLALVAFPRTR